MDALAARTRTHCVKSCHTETSPPPRSPKHTLIFALLHQILPIFPLPGIKSVRGKINCKGPEKCLWQVLASLQWWGWERPPKQSQLPALQNNSIKQNSSVGRDLHSHLLQLLLSLMKHLEGWKLWYLLRQAYCWIQNTQPTEFRVTSEKATGRKASLIKSNTPIKRVQQKEMFAKGMKRENGGKKWQGLGSYT